MAKEITNKIKIFLLKDHNEDNYLKDVKTEFVKDKQLDCQVNRRIKSYKVPKWYRDFFNTNDIDITGKLLECYFERKIIYENINYKFVISFGGADSSFDLSKFVDDFGLKVAFNICDKFVRIQKSHIATTMSVNKEYATKKDSFSSFVIDETNDLLTKVTIFPRQDNDITLGNLTGGVELSFSTNYKYNNIDELLKKIIKNYLSDYYKKNYNFIDNIKAINNDKTLIESIHEKEIDLIKDKCFDKVWFGLPFIDDWDNIENFIVKYKDQENVYDDILIENICNDFTILDYKDLNRIKVIPQYSNDVEADYIKLSDCIYGEIEYNGVNYVINGGNIYRINKNYAQKINHKYDNIEIYSGLPDRIKNGPESDYNESVELNNSDKFINIDKILYSINKSKIEIADLFCKETNSFIHVKKYGGSSVLSHLFLQALNSTELLADSEEKEKVLQVLAEKGKIIEKDSENKKYNVVMAIITQKRIEKNEHLNIPFFSKMSISMVVDKIKKLGFEARIAYIYSSVSLRESK